MAENMAFVDAHASDWHFDHLNGQPFDWDTGLVADDQLDLNEANLYASFFDSGAFWGQGVQDESNGKMPANFPQGSSMEAPPVATGKQEWHDPETKCVLYAHRLACSQLIAVVQSRNLTHPSSTTAFLLR